MEIKYALNNNNKRINITFNKMQKKLYVIHTLASLLTAGLAGNSTSVAFRIVFSSSIVA